MQFHYDPFFAKETWHFGKWILTSSAFTFAASNADKIIFGSVLDVRTFGHYTIATAWVSTISFTIQKISEQVGFPVLSEVLAHRSGHTQRIFGRLSLALDTLVILSFFVAIFILPLFILMLYTEEYSPSAVLIPLISVTILHQHFWLFSRLFLALGDTRTLAMNSALYALLLCCAVPAGFYQSGLKGALFAMVAIPPMAHAIFLVRPSPVRGAALVFHWAWLIGTPVAGVALLLMSPLR
jgi:O-antigen/teichoic acid export membrane protein